MGAEALQPRGESNKPPHLKILKIRDSLPIRKSEDAMEKNALLAGDYAFVFGLSLNERNHVLRILNEESQEEEE